MADTGNLSADLKHMLLDLRQMKSFCEHPLIIKEAKGVYLTDIEGKRYIDGISGIYVVNIGHGNEYVIEALRRQQERVCFVAPMHAVADISIEYAKRLTTITPDPLNTVKLLSGGSEATETAMKFSRQYHRQTGNPFKYKVIANYRGFHGATLGALSASGLGGPRKSVFGPFLEGFVHIPPPTCFRCPYKATYPGCDILCAQMLGQVIEGEGAESVAAFIMEPIGNTGGIVTPPQEYFDVVRKTCTKYGVTLIFDEIITGMGRTGNWFAAQTYNTEPDILCTGKGLGSGYAPLAAAIMSDDMYFGAFWGEEEQDVHFAHGHTFAGNPISAAIGLAALEVIEREGLIQKGQELGDHIRRRLEQEVRALGILGEVRGKGCLVGVEFVEDMSSGKPFAPERRFGKCVERRLIENGLILRCDPDWIAFGPPFVMTIEQADEMIEVFIDSVREELESGASAR